VRTERRAYLKSLLSFFHRKKRPRRCKPASVSVVREKGAEMEQQGGGRRGKGVGAVIIVSHTISYKTFLQSVERGNLGGVTRESAIGG